MSVAKIGICAEERPARLFDIVSAAPGRSVDARGIGSFKTAMTHLGILPRADMAPPVGPLSEDEAAAVIDIVRAWQDSAPGATR